MNARLASLALVPLVATLVGAGEAPPVVTPRGDEFFLRGSDTASGNRVAIDDSGSFLALFYDVFSGSVDARGGTLETLLAPFSISGGARAPGVAGLGDGEFAISWSQDEAYPGSSDDIRLQTHLADGTPTAPPVEVSEGTGFLGTHTDVGARPDSFVVVWRSGSESGIELLGQVVPSDGPAPPPLALSAPPTGAPTSPRLDVAPDGRTLVVWRQTDCTPDDPEGGCVRARGIDPAGGLPAPEFQVNGDTTGAQSFPVVAGSTDTFVVVWTSTACGSSCIQGRLFDTAGAPLGDDFRIDEPGADSVDRAGVAMTSKGDFIVSWLRREAGDSLTFARAFAPDGLPRTGEFQVNTDPASEPYETDVAINDKGNFIVVWSDNYNLWGRFFDLEVALFDDGFESGDTSRWDTVVEVGQAAPVAARPAGRKTTEPTDPGGL